MVGVGRNVKSCDMPSYKVHSEARGPHWIAWISLNGGGKPHHSVVLVAATREEAEASARA